MTAIPKPGPPAHRPDSAGKSLDERLAEVGQDLRRLDAARSQHAATCRAAATWLRSRGPAAIGPEDVLALAALLDALASGSASTAIRRRAYLLAQGLNR